MTKRIRSIPQKFDWIALGNEIEARKLELRLQNRDLAVLADTSSSVISRVIQAENENYETNTILKITNALDIDLRQFIVLDV